jgi:hypothetical protein
MTKCEVCGEEILPNESRVLKGESTYHYFCYTKRRR